MKPSRGKPLDSMASNAGGWRQRDAAPLLASPALVDRAVATAANEAVEIDGYEKMDGAMA